ncbi:hypothetical protein CLHUN_34990 [Ruminiclostridium hungatei]|uniref:DUF5668 domain-containing protein n=1 Tax=Ruminiclostridium hungatei TaxID=48256 RepID=A0A1V4SHE5_RUMHU|nr:hypothetical protein [Ruminiclostridium hungatei]OPX42677.1 hypothetical protein CLHUN_34990 [Ruminiclostridium hungatei]
MKRNNGFVGLLLIAIGVIVLLLRGLFGIRLFEFNSVDFWVFIVLLVGLSFELAFFVIGSKPGLLIPGGIITTIGLLFMFEVTTDWNFAEYTWPVYIFSVAVGLFQMYIFSKRQKGLLVASLIVGGVAAFFMVCMLLNRISSVVRPEIFIPIALICGGIALFCSGRTKKPQY